MNIVFNVIKYGVVGLEKEIKLYHLTVFLFKSIAYLRKAPWFEFVYNKYN